MRKLFYLVIFSLTIYSCESRKFVSIVTSKGASDLEQLAAKELQQKLRVIYPSKSFQITQEEKGGEKIYLAQKSNLPSELLTNFSVPENPEGYHIKSIDEQTLMIASEGDKGILYGVYGLLEKLGYSYTLNEDIAPLPKTEFSFLDWDIVNEPLAKERIIFNWHNFLSGCSGWNYEDWEMWINQSQKMGYNTLMIHLYPNNPIFDFEHNGFKKEVGFLASSHRGRDWCTEHVNDVRRLPGGKVFDNARFASEAALVPDSLRVDAVQKMMSKVFAHAEVRGMNINFSYDFDMKYSNPQDMVLSLPEESRFLVQNNGVGWMGEANAKEPIWLVRPDTPEGYEYYKAQVVRLMELYPQIDKLTLWKRVENSPWTSIKKEELPKTWQQEFDSITTQNVEVLSMNEAIASFAQAKLIRVFRQILNEIDRSEVKLGFGTWRWYSTEAMNFFYPEDIQLFLLDSEITRIWKERDLHHKGLLDELSAFTKQDRIVPILWAHHDDGAIFGSSLKPYQDLTKTLNDIKAESYGVFHWMTRPFDAWIINHGRQVWSATQNQPYEVTLEGLAKKWFGNQGKMMAEYMKTREKDMPHFGRDTRQWFIDDVHYKYFDSVEVVIEGCKQRIKLLEQIDTDAFSAHQLSIYQYYKLQEQFVAELYEQQCLFLDFEESYKEGDFKTAKEIATRYKTSKVLGTFSKMIQKGTTTRGEKGLLFSMGLRWHPHFLSQQQRVGVSPIYFNFSNTYHEPMAQMPGKNAYFIDDKEVYWKILGERETGKSVKALSGTSEAFVKSEGYQLDTPLTFEITTYTYSTLKTIPLMAGTYQLQILMPEQQQAENLQLKLGGKTYLFEVDKSGNAITNFELDGEEIPKASISSSNGENVVFGVIIERKN